VTGGGEVFVVFDPFVLRSAFFEDSGPETEALKFLCDHCNHRLLWDDKLGKLQEAYARDLPGGTIGLILGRVQQDLYPIGKLQTRAGPARVTPLRGFRGQHRRFFLAALSMQPNYIVTVVRQILPLANQIQEERSVRVLSPSDYAAMLTG
jgi:hypothetical protein